MKTAEEILSEHSKNYGAINNNPRAIVKAPEAIDAMREYAKQLLEEYADRVVKNIKMYDANDVENPELDKEGNPYEDYRIDKESITFQLELFKKEIGL